MPILNYTTKIPVHQTVGEILQILAKAGATNTSIDYDAAGEPVALTFTIRVQDFPLRFRLPSKHAGVLKLLENDKSIDRTAYRTEAHARRVAWRIVKDWIDAQLALVEAEQASLAEVFLPYAVTKTGNTLYQEFEANQKMLSDIAGK